MVHLKALTKHCLPVTVLLYREKWEKKGDNAKFNTRDEGRWETLFRADGIKRKCWESNNRVLCCFSALTKRQNSWLRKRRCNFITFKTPIQTLVDVGATFAAFKDRCRRPPPPSPRKTHNRGDFRNATQAFTNLRSFPFNRALQQTRSSVHACSRARTYTYRRS